MCTVGRCLHFLALNLAIGTGFPCLAQTTLVYQTSDLRHLRSDGPREWSEFPQQAQATALICQFETEANRSEFTLRLRQQDVKRKWNISLNGQSLGELRIDENDMVVYFAVPPMALKTGANELRIEESSPDPNRTDDIRVGEVEIDSRSMETVLGESAFTVSVIDADGGKPLPARLTIVNEAGALQTTAAASSATLAVRPGIDYAATCIRECLPHARALHRRDPGCAFSSPADLQGC